MSVVLCLWMVLYFCCLFSYSSLLELHYRVRMRRSQTAREQTREVGLSIREAEQRIDAELFHNNTPGGIWGTPLICHPAQDVPTCCLVRPERGRKACLPRPPGQCVETQPRGRPIHHGTLGVPDLSQGDLGHLPQCLSVEKVSRSPTLWISAEKRSNP